MLFASPTIWACAFLILLLNLGSPTLLPLSVQFLLAFELNQEFPIQPSWLPVLDFLHIGMGNSCTLRRLSLKVNQLSWAPLSFKAVAHVILPTSLTWRFHFLMSLRILKSTVSSSSKVNLDFRIPNWFFLIWEWQLYQEVIPSLHLHCLWKKLSLTYSINLVDSLCPEMSPLQQISVWFKPSLTNKACSYKASSRFFEKTLSTSLWNGLLSIHCSPPVMVSSPVMSKCNLWLSP